MSKGETKTMNENLSEMVKEQTEANPAMFSESDLDLPPGEEEQAEEAPQQETQPAIGITTLSSWFEANAQKFANINQVKVAIRGVDSSKTLIMAVSDGTGEKDESGNEKRNLRVFENADTYPVLDLEPYGMDVYNNGFRVLYNYGENVVIKCYGVKTSLIAVFCNVIDGKLIPYSITRVKRKDDSVAIEQKDTGEVAAKLNTAVDNEALILRYKQAAKSTLEFRTNKDAIDWLIARQDEITDINHHLQIDNIIIDTLG